MNDQLNVINLVLIFCLIVRCNECDDVPFSIKYFYKVTLEEKSITRVGTCDFFFSKVFDIRELFYSLKYDRSIINFKQFHLGSVHKEDCVVRGTGQDYNLFTCFNGGYGDFPAH